MENDLSYSSGHLALLIPVKVSLDFGLVFEQRAGCEFPFDEIERGLVNVAQELERATGGWDQEREVGE